MKELKQYYPLFTTKMIPFVITQLVFTAGIILSTFAESPTVMGASITCCSIGLICSAVILTKKMLKRLRRRNSVYRFESWNGLYPIAFIIECDAEKAAKNEIDQICDNEDFVHNVYSKLVLWSEDKGMKDINIDACQPLTWVEVKNTVKSDRHYLWITLFGLQQGNNIQIRKAIDDKFAKVMKSSNKVSSLLEHELSHLFLEKSAINSIDHHNAIKEAMI